MHFSFKKTHLKTSGKWRPICFGLNVLKILSAKCCQFCCVWHDVIIAKTHFLFWHIFPNDFRLYHQQILRFVSWVYNLSSVHSTLLSVIKWLSSYQNTWLRNLGKSSFRCVRWHCRYCSLASSRGFNPRKHGGCQKDYYKLLNVRDLQIPSLHKDMHISTYMRSDDIIQNGRRTGVAAILH